MVDNQQTQTLKEVRERGLARLSNDFSEFFSKETSGALIMGIAAIISLFLANTGIFPAFDEFWKIEAGFVSGTFEFLQTYKHWIDDALMAIFFFVIGLEIKREVLVGELSSIKDAMLPILAAIGGMAIPALIYLGFNAGTDGASGWGIPIATDIAFALGLLAVLMSHVPRTLKVFLSAAAISDDIGAILAIAVFYTKHIEFGWLAAALIPLAFMFIMNRMKVDHVLPYVMGGVALWFCMLNSGVHATSAGVMAAFLIPSVARINPLDFTDNVRQSCAIIDDMHNPEDHVLKSDDEQIVAYDIAAQAKGIASPLQRLEHSLLPFVTFIILPLFALANADIVIVGSSAGFGRVGLGVFFGLAVGKPLGFVAFSWLAIKLGIGRMPEGMNMKHILGAGFLAGIGFTMAMLISNLAFTGPNAADYITQAKIAILLATFVSGIVGFIYLRFFVSRR